MARGLWSEYGRHFPPDRLRPSRDPLASLVRTILSQNTSDGNSGRAFAALRERFPTWQEVLDAPVAQVASALHPGGLANVKAPQIQSLLRSLAEARGELDLSLLDQMEVPEAVAYLRRFRGVGAKTAACVLLFSLGKPVFPVDTHVLRVARRLGWVSDKTSAERAQEALNRSVPDELKLHLHLAMVRHGRRRCRPRQPACPGCPIAKHCRYLSREVGPLPSGRSCASPVPLPRAAARRLPRRAAAGGA